ncbi:hypothetical protein [Streptomyces indicus]|uniref:Lipoprotein n=1 Tax=Streptomyces indicus TaxID=417292 RepID=A0A1G9DCM2_9ACTN|nr:hypothetical protein [Streptomyces indicus]SDK61593.1 hypothetical protein SAMN05421806_109148 [Streptomyces indicus]
MGALRRSGDRRALAAAGAVAALALGLTACQDLSGGLNSVAVSITTDQKGTDALEKKGVDVQWLNCTSSFGEGGGTPNSSKSPTVRSVATVDCEGKTRDGRDITLTGKVTEERGGACVRGDLTAKVEGKTVLRADVLGNCADAKPTSRPPGNGGPQPTVTVTTTVTVYPPTCDCRPGK